MGWPCSLQIFDAIPLPPSSAAAELRTNNRCTYYRLSRRCAHLPIPYCAQTFATGRRSRLP